MGIRVGEAFECVKGVATGIGLENEKKD